MTPLERLRALQRRLADMDSQSGEAADIALALAVVDAARNFRRECNGPMSEDSIEREAHFVSALDIALSALDVES